MAGTVASSSGSAAAFSPKKYDVFINFRGEDTRYNFTSHLHTALLRDKVETYIDYRLEKGDEVWAELVKAIEDSHVSIVVFSKNYASSTWCLKELTKILNCKRDQGQLVIPVFYNVDPSVVRKQTGDYERAFAEHQHRTDNEVKKWKDALTEASNLSGWDSSVVRDESKLIQSVVNDVLEKLHNSYPRPRKNFVGIDESIEFIESLLEKAQIVGIWGMGGIGKTTIARALFDKISSQYEGCSFLENVREESQRHGLKYVRDKLLFELLEERNLCRVRESTFVSRRLSSKKVLIVLDDVSSFQQLDDLDEICSCMRSDSRIIVTTRYKKVLNARVHQVYKVNELDFQSSLMLFCLNAFNKSHPNTGYEELSKRVVHYAKGIPLALKVLGRCLVSESKEIWESMLGELKKQSHAGIQSVLRLSYDGLNDMHKEIFLDIACFFKGEFKEHVIQILEACGFYAPYGIKTLEDHALISISDSNIIHMHDLIQVMGWNIVHEESIKHPGRQRRLINAEDICDVLKYKKGTDANHAIQGICLDMSSQNEDLSLRPDIFKEMINLRYLKIYSYGAMGKSKLYFLGGLESLPDKLRYLEWHRCLLKSLPSTFGAHKLYMLCLPNSHLEKLWDGVQDLVNLKKIDLCASKNLIELPDLSKASNLESVNLHDCTSLSKVHPSILSLHKLKYLCITFSERLKEFSVTPIRLSMLKFLFLHNCKRLRSLPELPPSLVSLDAFNCASLKTVFPFKGYKHFISFGNCFKLGQHSFDGITLKPGKRLCVWYPGSRVPEWFNTHYNGTKQGSDLVGYVFCMVVHFSSPTFDYIDMKCECYLDDDKTAGRAIAEYSLAFTPDMHSDHVSIWYDPAFCESILKATRNPKLSFQFSVDYDPDNCRPSIREWGMCPIYETSDVEIFLRMGTKRRRDIDELEMDLRQLGIGVANSGDEQPLPQCKKLKLSVVQTKKSRDIDELEALFLRTKIS